MTIVSKTQERICFVLLIFFLNTTIVHSQGLGLYEINEEPQQEWAAKQVAEIQRAPIEIDWDVLNEIRDQSLTEFRVLGLDGEYYQVRVTRIIEQIDGDWSLIGHIDNNRMDSFLLSYSQGEILGSFRHLTSHIFLEIRYLSGSDEHFLMKIDPHEREALECGHDHRLGIPDQDDTNQSFNRPEFPEQTGTTIIDVMVVFTPAARTWAGTFDGGIQNVINQAMAVAQNSADNSGLDLQFRLVHTAEVSYTETGSSTKDLENLTFGNIPNVHTLRDQHAADLVSMFTRTNDSGGVAWVLNTTNGAPDFGYSITRVQQASWTSTHAHEMGHNFGGEHSRNQTVDPAPASGGLYEYSTGWRWTGNNGVSYSSVMTYTQSSTAVDIFSNPDISWQGVPTGSYSGQYAPADNTRSMRNIKGVIAGYRSGTAATNPPIVTTASVSSVSSTSAVGGGTVTNDGGSSVTSRGICWSRTQNPGLMNHCRTSGSGLGSYSVTMSELQPNSTYHVRAYAVNSIGTSFGNQVSFATSQVAADPVESSIASSATKVQANNQNHSVITVIARDQAGNRLGGFQTSLTSLSGTLQSSPQSRVTDSNGEARFEVTNFQVEPVRYSAVIGGVSLQSSVVVNFIGIDAQRSELSADETEIQANGSDQAEIVVTARDETGTPFSNLNMVLLADGGSSVIEAVQPTTNSNGVAIFRVSNRFPETITYSARGLGTTIHQTVTLDFIPLAPVALSASEVETRSFNANWEMVAGADGYLLDVSEDPSFESFLQGYNSRSVGNVTTHTVAPAAPGTDYHYRVRATFGDVTGFYSDIIELTTFPETPVAISASDRNARMFRANWEEAEGARSYHVDVAKDDGFEQAVPGYENMNVQGQTSLVVNNLDPGFSYYYRVRSVAGSRTSDHSNVIEASTLSISVAQSLIEQEQLRVLANGLQRNPVEVTVKSEEGVALRDLTVALIPDVDLGHIEPIQPVTDEDGVALFELSSVEAASVTYRVLAHSIEVGSFTVEYLANEGRLALGNNFPNPFQTVTALPVIVPERMVIHINIYDMLGKPVYTLINEEMDAGYYEIPFFRSDLASGVYFYRLFSPEGIETKQMVLIR